MARRRVAVRGKKSLKTWIATGDVGAGPNNHALLFEVPSVTGNPGAGGIGATVGFFTVANETDLTLLRTFLSIGFVGEAANDGQYMINIGMGVVSEQAAVAGVGSIPNPMSNSDWDGWVLHKSLSLQGGTPESRADTQIWVDSKAMRKIPAGNSIILVAQAHHLTGAATDPVEMAIFGRFLVKTSN